MDAEGTTLTCSVTLEWTNAQGTLIRKVNHRSASARLIRNDVREICIEVRADKANLTTRLTLKDFSLFNRFMAEGKASIKFQREKCTLFLSNAPTANLINFLKTIYIKVNGQPEAAKKNPLKERLLSNKALGGVQEISPATTAETEKARQRALAGASGALSRGTGTTPSPGATKKRKFIGENLTGAPRAKKLYENPTLLELTEEQKKVLETVLRGRNVFFTGSAGTGKSFLLKRIIAALPPDVTVATASTGVAACHIGGVTLHQFSGIGLGTGNVERCCELASRPNPASIWRKTKHLIIDEISMVDGDFFDKIEAVARHVRKNDKPFGGIQLVLCGDFFQLPPVGKRDEKIKFCFQSKAWQNCVHFNFELEQVHRQKDPKFIKVLNSIRIGRVTEEISETLKATSKQKVESDGIVATRLCSHVEEANEINQSQLELLSGEAKVYLAEDSDKNMSKTLDQQVPVPGRLVLKVGSQVMLLKNINISNGLVNGARGVVTKFVEGIPLVHFRSGERYLAKSEKWVIKTVGGSLVHRTQIPLKLAWAFSIHKSQGLTLDCVEMCLNRVFDAGQAYVALSRAQSLQALRVLNFDSTQVWANTSVLEFYRRFRRQLHEMEIVPVARKSKINRK